MRFYSQLGAIILASMAGLMAVAESVPPSDSDSLLQGPLGLVWPDSQNSMVGKDLVITMAEFFDYIGENTDKDRGEYPPTDPSCFQYEGCYTFNREKLGGLFNVGRFEFEENQLVAIYLLYYVRVNETNPEFNVAHLDPLYQSL